MNRCISFIARHAVATTLIAVAGPAGAQTQPTWSEVGPLFAERCVVCHSGPAAPAGLQLDTLAHALAGGVNGPVLLAGNPQASELVRRVRGESQPRMPLAGDPLTAEQIAMVEAWVLTGMPDGAATANTATPAALPTPPASGEPVTFAHVEPIFLQRCVSCHSVAGVMGPPPEELRLHTYDAVIEGGERLAVFPGRPEFSEILRRVTALAQPAMPFGGPPLTEAEIDLLRRWIEGGATDAAGLPAALPVGAESGWMEP